MTDQLKQDTQQSHQSLESFLIPVIKNVFTVPEYSKLLRMFYGYYKPVEDAIDRFPVSLDLPDYGDRRKAQLILNDLQALNDESAVPLCSSLSEIHTIEQAYGALYVLEGSTLGGLIITKILQRNLQLQDEKGFMFFSGYGQDTGSKWAIFKQVLANYCLEPDMYTRVSSTANQTFIQLKTWAQINYHYECSKEKL